MVDQTADRERWV